MTRQDTHEIVYRYFRHSSSTGDVAVFSGVVTASSLYLSSVNSETNWVSAVTNGKLLFTQLNEADLSITRNIVLGITEGEPKFVAQDTSADEKSLFLATDYAWTGGEKGVICRVDLDTQNVLW